MLIKNDKYENDVIVTFKIVNGDELVAKVVSDEAEQFVLSKPMTIVPSAKGVGLVQSLFSVDTSSTIPLKKMHVIMHHPSAEPVADHYREITTGIQTVRNGGIIT